MSDDETAIRRLIAAYVDGVNLGSPASAAATYAEDGELVFYNGTRTAGRAALEAAFTETFSMFEFMFQMPHSAMVDIDGDRATTRIHFSEVNRRKSDGRPGLFIGCYQDEATRTTDGWRFARRTLHAIYRGAPDLTGTVLGTPPKLGDFSF